MARVGYARVATPRQSLDPQLDAVGGKSVHGVLFKITDKSDWDALDRAEGTEPKGGYRKDNNFLVRRSDTEAEISVTTYIAKEEESAGRQPFGCRQVHSPVGTPSTSLHERMSFAACSSSPDIRMWWTLGQGARYPLEWLRWIEKSNSQSRGPAIWFNIPEETEQTVRDAISSLPNTRRRS